MTVTDKSETTLQISLLVYFETISGRKLSSTTVDLSVCCSIIIISHLIT